MLGHDLQHLVDRAAVATSVLGIRWHLAPDGKLRGLGWGNKPYCPVTAVASLESGRYVAMADAPLWAAALGIHPAHWGLMFRAADASLPGDLSEPLRAALLARLVARAAA